MPVDPDLFRNALARFASGVTIVTTIDGDGRRWGFTASAFSALSLDPPMVVVCLATSADSHSAFTSAERYAIHILSAQQRELALHFARKGSDKFAGCDSHLAADGLPAFAGALARISCTGHALHDGGDHSILVGRVDHAELGEGAPLLHFDRRFWSLPPARAESTA